MEPKSIKKGFEKLIGNSIDFKINLGVLFGTKLEWEMDKYCAPKGIQKTSEKRRGGGARPFLGTVHPFFSLGNT